MKTLTNTLLSEAKKWIEFNTVSSHSNQEFVGHLKMSFRSLGFHFTKQKVVSGKNPRYNFLAWYGPPQKQPLLLNTHLDTVPPGPWPRWTATHGHPFCLTQKKNLLYGLGVADVKLNLLCQIQALKHILPCVFQRPLCIVGTCCEESGMKGAQYLIKNWEKPKPELAVIGEPTEQRLINKHRGYLVFQWTIKLPTGLFKKDKTCVFSIPLQGKTAHSSTPELGKNAFQEGFLLLQKLKRAGMDPKVIQLSGGTAPNQVPADACLEVAIPSFPLKIKNKKIIQSHLQNSKKYHLIPWETIEKGLKKILCLLSPQYSMNVGLIEKKQNKLTVTFDIRIPCGHNSTELIKKINQQIKILCRINRITSRLVIERNNPPLDDSLSKDAYQLLKEVLTQTSLSIKPQEKLTCTEAGEYNQWGVPAVVWGPGKSRGNVHQPNESIAVSDLQQAVGFYQNLIRRWCL